MSFWENEVITRDYRCFDCEAEIEVTQPYQQWTEECPFCQSKDFKCIKQHVRILASVKGGTLGSIAEQNTKRLEKSGELARIEQEKKEKRPFWRNTDKIDYKILKNPKKYIRTGKA